MFKRSETNHTLGEHSDTAQADTASLLTTVEQLQAGLADLATRVDAQFTTIAGHAETARQQTEFARAEARADLDRTRDTIIELIESVRTDRGDVHVPGMPPGASAEVASGRLDAIDSRLDELGLLVERCFARQNELADTMTALLDTVLAERRGESVAGLSLG